MLSRTAIHTSDSAMIVRMVLVYRSTMCVSFGLGRSPRRATELAAKSLGLDLQPFEVRNLEHIPLDLNRGDSLSGLVERVYRH